MSPLVLPCCTSQYKCIYCYARPTHEYLGFSAGLDFETKILAKIDAPVLLRKELPSPKWVPQVIAMSGVTDCYQPIERYLQLTWGCLEVLAEFRNPVCIVTKNQPVTRDIDILSQLARYGAVSVMISITTLDDKLRRMLEPRTSHPEHRLKAIQALSEAGIPVGVMVAPIVGVASSSILSGANLGPMRPAPTSLMTVDRKVAR